MGRESGLADGYANALDDVENELIKLDAGSDRLDCIEVIQQMRKERA